MKVKGRHNKVKYLFIETIQELFEAGRGKSKHQIFQDSYERNKTRESPFIHSYSTRTTYEKVLSKFADFLNEEYNIKYEKDLRKLSTEELYQCVDSYFETQRDEEHLAKNTLEKHISALNKVLSHINPEIKEFFTADNRARWRDGGRKTRL
jgi:hypothetical protein